MSAAPRPPCAAPVPPWAATPSIAQLTHEQVRAELAAAVLTRKQVKSELAQVMRRGEFQAPGEITAQCNERHPNMHPAI